MLVELCLKKAEDWFSTPNVGEPVKRDIEHAHFSAVSSHPLLLFESFNDLSHVQVNIGFIDFVGI